MPSKKVTIDQRVNVHGQITTPRALLDERSAIVERTWVEAHHMPHGGYYRYALVLLNDAGAVTAWQYTIDKSVYERYAASDPAVPPNFDSGLEYRYPSRVGGTAAHLMIDGKQVTDVQFIDEDPNDTWYELNLDAYHEYANRRDVLRDMRDQFVVLNYEEGIVAFIDKERTAEEIEALKTAWLIDPCYDIETAEGFSFHSPELKAWRETLHRTQHAQRIADVRREFGLLSDQQAEAFLRLLDTVDSLKRRVGALESAATV